MRSRSIDAILRTGILVLVALVAGCATGPRLVPTDVISFDAWATLPAERTYVFSRTLEYQDSLELQSYEGIVRDELGRQGFRLAADPSQAQLVVTLRPSVSGTAVRVRDSWPIGPYRGYGWGYGGFYGAGLYGFGGPFGGYGFGYGGFYDGFDDRTIEIFKRRLELDIDSRTVVGKRYYEGRVESTGNDNSLPNAMPVLVRALFTDFPGNNGQTRRVNVPVERRAANDTPR